MSREKRKPDEMFYEFSDLSSAVRMLGNILQNQHENIEIPNDELLEWSDRVNEAINKLSMLREDVIRYYQD